MDNIIIKSGIIKNNEEWKGNIVVADDIVIPRGVSVVVHPNTRIKFKKKSQNKLFKKNYKLNYLIKKFNLHKDQYVDKIAIVVYGSLIINGKKEDIVDIGNDGWNGIIYAASKSKLIIKYTKIRYGFGIICGVNSQTAMIDSCIIEQCCLGIVAFSKILIKNSRINYNEIGVVCFKRFIIYKSKIVDNFYSGVKIISQKGFFSKNVTALNNVGTDVHESNNIKLYYNHYEFNNVGILIDKSHNIFINGFLSNNFINIFVCNYSYDIIVVCFIMLYIGVYVDNVSEVDIRNSFFINLYSILFSLNRSMVTINNIEASDVLVAVVSALNSHTCIKKTNIKAIRKCIISISNSEIISQDSTFNSGEEAFTNLNSKIFVENSKIEAKELVCMANINSDVFFYKVQMKSKKIFYAYNNSIVNLMDVLCEAKQSCFLLTGKTQFFISESKINSINDNMFELMQKSKVQIKSCEFISAHGAFAKIFDDSNLEVETTKIETFHYFCELVDFGKLDVKNSSIKNKKGWLIDAKRFASVNIENSKIKSFCGVKVDNNSRFECKNSYVFVLNNFLTSNSNSKIVFKNNNIRLFSSIIESYESSQIQLQLDNNFFAKNISIKANEYSDIIFFNSNFVALENIIIEYNNVINNLKNIFIKAKNIIVSNKNSTSLKIEESTINGKLDLNLNINADIYIQNSLIKDCFFIKRGTNGIIKITDSEIQGIIDSDKTGNIEIENSKVGNVRVKDNSQTFIRTSKIEGEFLDIGENGEVVIDDTIINLDKYIQDEGNARVSINGSKIYSEQGIRKSGEEIIEICNSEIESKETGIVIEKGEAEITGSKVTGRNGVEIGEKGRIKQKGLEIESKDIGLLYSSDDEIKIEGIKIVSEDIALRSNSKGIKITDSELEGDIDLEQISDVIIEESKICGKIKNTYNINIEKCDINDGELLFESCGNNINIIDSNIDSEIINIEKTGNVFINNTNIVTEKGLFKSGDFDLICNNSNIYSHDTCLNITKKTNNVFNCVCLNSKGNYSVVANNTNIELNNLIIKSKKGLLCEFNTNCKIRDMKADVLFNFCNISKTNFEVCNLDCSVVIPKECFIVNNLSKADFKNINLKIDYNPIYIQFFDNKSISYLSGDSKFFIDSLNLDIQIPNKMYFLRSDVRSVFKFNNINVSGLYNFLYIGNFGSGHISNSNINTKSIIFSMYQNSNLNVDNTSLTNKDSFKFITEDNSTLSLKSINVNGGQLVSMSKNSQLYITNSSIKADEQCCKMQGNTCFQDEYSKWQINSKDINSYAFYLLNNATMSMSSSKINVKEVFAYVLDSSSLRFDCTDILSETNNHMFLLADRAKTEIKNSKLNVYSIAQLRNYSNIIIEKSSAYIKDFIVNLIGNSKAFIKNVVFKNINKNENTAFEILHDSEINIKDSIIDEFYIGIKYENKNNIHIKNTKINSKNEMLFTNDKRFLSFSNPVQKNLLYKFQQFVLSTNNVFPLNKIYNFIYVISIAIYKFFTNKNFIQALYLRRGMLNNWIAGSSDIDYLTILAKTDVGIEYDNILDIKKRYKNLKKMFPFYGENLIFNEEELSFYLKYGGIRSKLLKNSKLLKGKQQDLKTDIVTDLKYKIDIIKEILNSYILLSNNYFYNIDIISDICFSKASTDILKYRIFL